MRIDLFPFLMVLLCAMGVQAVVVTAQSALVPFIQRIATSAASRHSFAIHQVIVTRQAWKIPDQAFVLVPPIETSSTTTRLPGNAMGRWKEELEKLANTLSQQTGQKPPMIEVSFDQFSISGLRYTLEILDNFVANQVNSTAGRSLSIRYRPWKGAS
jgi:hypothetical protein